jgi:hypothetical protein
MAFSFHIFPFPAGHLLQKQAIRYLFVNIIRILEALFEIEEAETGTRPN